MSTPKRPVHGVYKLLLENQQALMSAVFNIYNTVSISQSNTVGRDPTLERLARQAALTKDALDTGIRGKIKPTDIRRKEKREAARREHGHFEAVRGFDPSRDGIESNAKRFQKA